MSVARHHVEWLSLLETSGSFLSLPVLMRVFPQGLEAHDPALARSLRLAYDEWDENRAAKRPDPDIHREWLRYVLEEALGYPKEIILAPDAIPAGTEAKIAEHHETIRPDLAIAAPASHLPQELPVLEHVLGEGWREGEDSVARTEGSTTECHSDRTPKPAQASARMLIQIVPPGQGLE